MLLLSHCQILRHDFVFRLITFCSIIVSLPMCLPLQMEYDALPIKNLKISTQKHTKYSKFDFSTISLLWKDFYLFVHILVLMDAIVEKYEKRSMGLFSSRLYHSAGPGPATYWKVKVPLPL